MGDSMARPRFGLRLPGCEIELTQAPKGSTARCYFDLARLWRLQRRIQVAPQRLWRRTAKRMHSIPRIRATTTEISEDEIFVMLFCRSIVQFAFMQKARSMTANS
jgi:hypothetical protein